MASLVQDIAKHAVTGHEIVNHGTRLGSERCAHLRRVDAEKANPCVSEQKRVTVERHGWSVENGDIVDAKLGVASASGFDGSSARAGAANESAARVTIRRRIATNVDRAAAGAQAPVRAAAGPSWRWSLHGRSGRNGPLVSGF